jgi:hypothetical protein
MIYHLGVKYDDSIVGTIVHNIDDSFLNTVQEFVEDNGQEELIEEIMRGQYEGGIYEFDDDGGVTMLESGRRHSKGSENCLNAETFGINADTVFLVENEKVSMTETDKLFIEDVK